MSNMMNYRQVKCRDKNGFSFLDGKVDHTILFKFQDKYTTHWTAVRHTKMCGHSQVANRVLSDASQWISYPASRADIPVLVAYL